MVAAWRQKGLPLMLVLLFHIAHLLSNTWDTGPYGHTLASIESGGNWCQDDMRRNLTNLRQGTGGGQLAKASDHAHMASFTCSDTATGINA